ncbi:hypothetical protein AGDE_16643 [Angomonas deanei]|nr:hypothetical protein AGDE_16643 [Angomonas deanei]|eukprot:EPY16704.1 hypothetical protein AGDE_16643 [Angomonas deanei]
MGASCGAKGKESAVEEKATIVEAAPENNNANANQFNAMRAMYPGYNVVMMNGGVFPYSTNIMQQQQMMMQQQLMMQQKQQMMQNSNVNNAQNSNTRSVNPSQATNTGVPAHHQNNNNNGVAQRGSNPSVPSGHNSASRRRPSEEKRGPQNGQLPVPAPPPVSSTSRRGSVTNANGSNNPNKKPLLPPPPKSGILQKESRIANRSNSKVGFGLRPAAETNVNNDFAPLSNMSSGNIGYTEDQITSMLDINATALSATSSERGSRPNSGRPLYPAGELLDDNTSCASGFSLDKY